MPPDQRPIVGSKDDCQTKIHCIKSGYGGFVTADKTNDASTKFYNFLSTDQILEELDNVTGMLY